MRIGILCHSYPPHPGGVEVIVQNLARGLAPRHEVIVVTTAWQGARGLGHENGFEVHRLSALHATEELGVPYPLPLGPGVRQAMAALRRADVLHAHGALYPTSLLAARTKKPLVLTEHVGFVEYHSGVLNTVERIAWRLLGDRVVRSASVVTAYNTRVQKWLGARFPGQPVRYLGNGVDAASFRPRPPEERRALRRAFGLPADALLVLFAARASQKKNIEVVLEIPRDAFHLVVCGGQRELRGDRLSDLGVLPHERMPDLFGCVDMMVHASHGEGLPLVVQEGLSSGVPLVLLWDEGYAGWISPETVVSCGSLEEVGRRTRELSASPDHRAVLSAKARAWATERWSWSATVEAYEALYREACEKGTDRKPASPGG